MLDKEVAYEYKIFLTFTYQKCSQSKFTVREFWCIQAFSLQKTNI